MQQDGHTSLAHGATGWTRKWRVVQRGVHGGGGPHLASQGERIHIVVASHSRRAGSPEGAIVVGDALQAKMLVSAPN